MARGRPAIDMAGQHFGLLSVIRRMGSRVSHNGGTSATWLCQCACGNQTVVVGSSLRKGETKSCGCLLSEAKVRSPDDAGLYRLSHRHVKALRGVASRYNCVDCELPAEEWSYNHRDPEELHSTDTRTAGSPFSMNPRYYDPRCRGCHRKFDQAQAMSITRSEYAE